MEETNTPFTGPEPGRENVAASMPPYAGAANDPQMAAQWDLPQAVPGQMIAPVGASMPPGTGYFSNYAQPGYPQAMYAQTSISVAPQPGQPGAVALRKRPFWLLAVLIVVLLVLLSSGTALAIVLSQRPTNTPTQALQQYCDGYRTDNAQEIYDTLSKASQQATTKNQIQEGLNALQLLGASVHITGCTVSNVQQNDTTAAGDLKMTISFSGGSFSLSTSVLFSMGLVLENRTWKINASQTHSTIPVPTQPSTLLTPTTSAQ